MAERITIEKMKALEAEYEVTIPEEIKKLLCDGEMDRSRRKVHLKYGEWEDETFLHGLYSTVNDVRTALDWLYEEWFPNGYIPFAYDEGGESFCVGVKPDNYGTIFLFISANFPDYKYYCYYKHKMCIIFITFFFKHIYCISNF